jgi:hypothetical protein
MVDGVLEADGIILDRIQPPECSAVRAHESACVRQGVEIRAYGDGRDAEAVNQIANSQSPVPLQKIQDHPAAFLSQ